jgi:hypothetical protein
MPQEMQPCLEALRVDEVGQDGEERRGGADQAPEEDPVAKDALGWIAGLGGGSSEPYLINLIKRKHY